VKIQVETESDAKVAKTLVFANSKWESLANFSWGEINVIRDACISFPPVDGFQPQGLRGIRLTFSYCRLVKVIYKYIYIYTMIQTEKDLPVGHSGHLKKDHQSRHVLSRLLFVGD